MGLSERSTSPGSRRVLHNMVWLNVASVLTNLMTLVMVVIMGRYLEPQVFGIYVFATALVALFETATDLGLGTLSIREVASHRPLAARYVGSFVVVKVTCLLVGGGGLGAALEGLRLDPLAKLTIWLLMGVKALESIGLFLSQLFVALEEMPRSALLQILTRLFLFLGTVAAVSWDRGLVGILVAQLLMNVLSTGIAGWFVAYRLRPASWCVDGPLLRSLLKTSLLFAALAWLSAVFNRAGMTILEFVKGEGEVAVYGAASYLVSALIFLPTNLSAVLYPTFSRLHGTSRQALLEWYGRGLRLGLIVFLPVALALWLWAGPVVRLVWGGRYAEAVAVVQWLSLNMIFVFIYTLSNNLLVAIKQERWSVGLLGIASGLSLLLHLTLAWRLGALGTAIAATLSSGVYGLLVCRALTGALGTISAAEWLKPLAALSFATGTYLGLQSYHRGLRIIGALGIYLMSLIWLKAIRSDEWLWLRHVRSHVPLNHHEGG